MNIEDLNLEELKVLKAKIDVLINNLSEEIEIKEFTFEFEATNDSRKGVPYVAKLFWNSTESKIDRKFFSLNKTYGKKEVTISGEYTVIAGNIIEIREGGSWKNDYRYWYLINKEGEKVLVADISNSADKMKVQKYLKGKISMQDLLGD